MEKGGKKKYITDNGKESLHSAHANGMNEQMNGIYDYVQEAVRIVTTDSLMTTATFFPICYLPAVSFFAAYCYLLTPFLNKPKIRQLLLKGCSDTPVL